MGDEAVAQEGGGEACFGEAVGGGHLGELHLDRGLDACPVEEAHGAVVQVVAAAQQDEGLCGKVREVDARAVRGEVAPGEDVCCRQALALRVAGTVPGDGQQDGVGEGGRAREVLDDAVVTAEGQVDLTLLQHVGHRMGAALEQVQPDLGKLPVELCQDAGQDVGVDEVAAANRDLAALQLADVIELMAKVLFERPRPLDGPEVDAPGGGQADGARAAVEDGHADLVFELADRDAQGRLGDEERLCRFGKALLPVNFVNVTHILLHGDSVTENL